MIPQTPRTPIPHVLTQQKVAIFRRALDQCSPEVQEWVSVLSHALATQLLGASSNLTNYTAALNYAHAVIAECIIKAKTVVE